MSLGMRKPVFKVSDQVRHKPGCTATEDGLITEKYNMWQLWPMLVRFERNMSLVTRKQVFGVSDQV